MNAEDFSSAMGVDNDSLERFDSFLIDFQRSFRTKPNSYYFQKYNQGEEPLDLNDDFLDILRESEGEMGNKQLVAYLDLVYPYEEYETFYNSERYDLTDLNRWEWAGMLKIKRLRKENPEMTLAEMIDQEPDFYKERQSLFTDAFDKPDASVRLYLKSCSAMNLNPPPNREKGWKIISGLNYWFGGGREAYKGEFEKLSKLEQEKN